MRRFFRVVLTVAVALWAGPAPAQNGADGGEPGAAVERARKMIFTGDPAGALDLLRPLADRFPDDTDVYFFRGMAAAAAAGLSGAAAVWRIPTISWNICLATTATRPPIISGARWPADCRSG